MNEKVQDGVKTATESPTVAKTEKVAETDVKPPTMKQTIDAFHSELVADGKAEKVEDKTASSAEGEKADGGVQKMNMTGGKEGTAVDEKADTKVEGKEGIDDEKEEPVKEAEQTEVEEKVDEKKHEEAVPYDRFKEKIEEVERLKPAVQEYEKLQKYCVDNNISADDFQAGMDFMALVNSGKHKEALEKLRPIVQSLEATVEGKFTYPAELKQLVDEGQMPKAQADEIMRLRREVELSKSQGQRTQQTAEQQKKVAAEKFQSDAEGELHRWAESKQKNDPSFKPKPKADAPDGKFEDFQDKFSRYWMEQPPKTIADIIGLAEKAKTAVDGTAKRYAPVPPVKKVLTTTGSSANNGVKKLTTLEDKIEHFASTNGIKA